MSARLYACKATVDMLGLTMDDFVLQVEEIISVGEFYETSSKAGMVSSTVGAHHRSEVTPAPRTGSGVGTA